MTSPLAARTAIFGAAWLLAGCGSWQSSTEPWLGMISPYRIDIQQGNVVTSDQIARLQPGMTRLQVRDILGTPLLNDPFHADRWDYIFTLAIPGKPLQRRDVTLRFEGDRLSRIESPELPSEREFVASVARGNLPQLAQALELGEEQLKALPKPPKPAASASAPGAQPEPRSYPPLEPS